MSKITVTRVAKPDTPATDKSNIYVDTADRRIKQLDDTGLISILNNDGLQDRNIITNGGFSIQQRVATASTAIPSISTTTRAGQVADRWAVTVGNTTTCSWAQIDTAASPETGLESRYYGKITQASNAAKFMLSQFIINSEMAHLRGKKVRVSVKIKQFVGSLANFRLGLLQLTAAGTVDVCPAFSSAIGADNVDPTFGTNLTLITPDSTPVPENCTVVGNALTIVGTTNWLRSSGVFTVPIDAKNLCVVLYRQTVGGATDATGVAEFQLTSGPDIVDYVEPPLAETLIRCKRFFDKSFPLIIVPAASVTLANGGYGACAPQMKAGSGVALAIHIPIQFTVPMWKVPSAVTLFTPVGAGAVAYRHEGVTPAVQGTTAVMTSSTTNQGCVVSATTEASANGVVGDLCSVHYTAEAEFIT